MRTFLVALVTCALALTGCTASKPPSADGFRTLAVSEYRQRMVAGWLGQMIGVGYGGPTEFSSLGRIIPEEDLPRYHHRLVNNSFGQDDLYVEMTFLRTLQEHGLGVSAEQAGLDFANSRYRLWFGNLAARDNLRDGIAPPDSGHPSYNEHPDAIDFQIEADFAGLISPGMPQQALAVGDRFGRMIGYGDGLYGGLFMACLYSEAFFIDEPPALVEAGLACIPPESQYAEAVRDVVGWWRADPDDWQKTWRLVDEKYHLDPDYRRVSSTLEGQPAFNIDAKLNGAYVVMGLLFGDRDPMRTMQVAMRSGQDSDCNPASAAGVLLTALDDRDLTAALLAELDRHEHWEWTDYDFDGLVAASEALARESVLAAGGRIERDGAGAEYFLIPVQAATPGALERSWAPGPAAGSRFSADELAQITVGGRD
ncbi:MAG: ADP-ribosylglycohydrolase family protein [Actinomycetes bacterium]